MDENNPNQTPNEQTVPPTQANKMLDDGSVVASSFVEGIDMDAINDAVDASKFTTAEASDSINVEDIDLNDTPTTDEALNRQLEQDPNMSLAHSANFSATTNSVVEAINDSQENMSSLAANLDRSEKPKEEEEEKKEDPSIHDAPTVNEVIIAPPRKHAHIALILILLLVIAAAAIGIIYFMK